MVRVWDPGMTGAAQGTEGHGQASGRRLALLLALVMVAGVLVVGARTDPGETEERLGRRMEIVELIAAEQERVRELEAEVADLAGRVASQEELAATDTGEFEELRAQLDDVSAPAGRTEVRGPGIGVTLDDAYEAWDGSGDPNDFLIHEADLRAVVNALWASGAEAMAINGERVLASSAIVCVGTTLRLNGAYYTPPYDIVAIGDPADLVSGLEGDPGAQRFAAAAEEFELGFSVEERDGLEVPAYRGSTVGELEVAIPDEGER